MLGTVYVVAQQVWRQSINGPLAVEAEQVAHKIRQVDDVSEVLGSDTVNLAKDSRPFIIISDLNYDFIAASAELNGNPPKLPQGVLRHVTVSSQNRITWQPTDSLRFATITTGIIKDGKLDGFVTVGQSLAETEKQVGQMGVLIMIGWLAGLIVLSGGVLAFRFSKLRR